MKLLHAARRPRAQAIVVLLCLPLSAWAQEPASLPELKVGAPTAPGSDLDANTSAVQVLEGSGLRLRQAASFGETVSSLPGVHSSGFGPNAGRPIIRGAEGERAALLVNGGASLDASSASADHQVAIDPMSLDRVELVRGPGALLYGVQVTSGLLNAVDSRLPTESPGVPLAGALETRIDTAASARSASLRLDGGDERVAWHFDAGQRLADDLRIPGFQYTPGHRAALQGAGLLAAGDSGPRGRLPGSAARSGSAGAGASLLFGERGHLGLSVSELRSTYGTVAEPDVAIDLRQTRVDLAGAWRPAAGDIESLRSRLSWTDYAHVELASGVPGTRFANRGLDWRFEESHRRAGGVRGNLGLQWQSSEFSATGQEAFLPATRTDRLAAFGREIWPLARDLELEGSARLEQVRLAAQDFRDADGQTIVDPHGSPLLARDRQFLPASAALSLTWKFATEWSAHLVWSDTARAPAAQELFAFGPHVATGTFEIGDAGLGMERARGLELGLRHASPQGQFSASLWQQNYSRYIAQLATGSCYEAGSRLTTAGTPPCNPHLDLLPAYRYAAVPARFEGVELEGRRPLGTPGRTPWSVDARMDAVRATNLLDQSPLPRIPALRFGLGLTWTAEGLAARVEAVRLAAQSRVPLGESATSGSTQLNASFTQRWRLDGRPAETFVRLTNLLNQDIRLASSFLRDLSPSAARSVMMGLRISF